MVFIHGPRNGQQVKLRVNIEKREVKYPRPLPFFGKMITEQSYFHLKTPLSSVDCLPIVSDSALLKHELNQLAESSLVVEDLVPTSPYFGTKVSSFRAPEMLFAIEALLWPYLVELKRYRSQERSIRCNRLGTEGEFSKYKISPNESLPVTNHFVRLDANGLYDKDQIIKLRPQLEELQIDYIEEPTANPKEWRSISQHLQVPIAVDESWNQCGEDDYQVIVYKPSMRGISPLFRYMNDREQRVVLSTCFEPPETLKLIRELAASFYPNEVHGLASVFEVSPISNAQLTVETLSYALSS